MSTSSPWSNPIPEEVELEAKTPRGLSSLSNDEVVDLTKKLLKDANKDLPPQHPAVDAYLSAVCEARALMQKSEGEALTAMMDAVRKGEVSPEQVRHVMTTTHIWMAACALEIPLSASYSITDPAIRNLLPKDEVLEAIFLRDFSRLLPMTVNLCMKRNH